MTASLILRRTLLAMGAAALCMPAMAELAPPEPVDSFILYESHLGRDGAHYEEVAAFPLG